MISRVRHEQARGLRDQTTALPNGADRRLFRAKRLAMQCRSVAVAAAGFACLTWLGIPQRAVGQTAQEVPSAWSLIPSGLSAGDSFRLLFVSSATRDATAADIATYDTHVQTAAASGHTDIQSYSTHFKALGSTLAVDALDNTATTYTSSDPGVPIYWLDGDKVADDYSDFYDGDWDSNAPKTEFGAPPAASGIEIFTGSIADGTRAGRFYLGRPAGNPVQRGQARYVGCGTGQQREPAENGCIWILRSIRCFHSGGRRPGTLDGNNRRWGADADLQPGVRH